MTSCKKHLFSLPPDVHFLNCATFSPNSRAVEAAGIAALQTISNPIGLKSDQFFDTAQEVREVFSQLLHISNPNRVAIVPSVSYGLAVVAQNLHRLSGIEHKRRILILEQEFPNNMYAFERVAETLSLQVESLNRPEGVQIGQQWNEQILDALKPDVALIVVPPVHWIYGTRFDLEAISQRCKENGTLLVIDAVQAAGAYPIDVDKLQPDALLAGSYKWLMGAYATGFAYFGEFFDGGVPLEETWLNRENSQVFHKLTEYQPNYRPFAQRYNVGEFGNFVSLPMVKVALQELLDWGVEHIQHYCHNLVEPIFEELAALGCQTEVTSFRASHLFGVSLPPNTDAPKLQETLTQRKVMVAVRANAIRVSPHVYNDRSDMDALIEAMRGSLTKK